MPSRMLCDKSTNKLNCITSNNSSSHLCRLLCAASNETIGSNVNAKPKSYPTGATCGYDATDTTCHLEIKKKMNL